MCARASRAIAKQAGQDAVDDGAPTCRFDVAPMIGSLVKEALLPVRLARDEDREQLTNPRRRSACSTYHLVPLSEPTGR